MRKYSVLIALILIIALSTTAFAANYDSVEKTHGTHASPGITVYVYSENGKSITKTENEVIDKCPMEKFSDLYSNIWCHEGLDFVLSKGYMLGKDNTSFDPDGSMTRAMIVTVLHRIAGDLGLDVKPHGKVPFADTPVGAWYYDALTWAYNNNIAKGFTEKSFAPNATVTREQITLFISRFAKFIGDDTSSKGDISKFSDVKTLSAESKTAIAWAVGKGILKGYDSGEIRPAATATRAHFASMLQRWMDGRCTEHDYVLTKSEDESCTVDGSKYYECSVCGAEKYVRVPAKGHSYGSKEIVTSPTCTSDGKYVQTCSECGYKVLEAIPATGHSYGEKQIGKPASCTEQGTYIKVCSSCGDELSVGSIPVTEHNYIEKIAVQPSCTETGTKQKTCSECGAVLTMEIPMLAHNYVDGVCDMCGRLEREAAKVETLKNGDCVIVFNPKCGLCLGTSEEGIGVSAVPASAKDNKVSIENGAAVLTVEMNDGSFYLKSSDGKYLTCVQTDNGSELCFSERKADCGLWRLSDGYIINVGTVVDGEEQYIECSNNCFKCYELTSKTDNYMMELYKTP